MSVTVHPFLLTSRTIFTIVVWMVLNISLTMYNKYLFRPDRFNFPILTTISHQLIGFLCGLYSLRQPDTISKLRDNWRPFCCLGVVVCATVSFGNLSLRHLHVSTVQIIKSTVPVFQIFVAKLVEGRSYPVKTNLVIPFMSVGAILAIWGERPDYSLQGYLLAFGSSVTQAMHVSFSAVLVSDVKVSNFVTWLYQSFICFWLLLIPFFTLEFSDFMEHTHKQGWMRIFPYLGVGMLLAFSYNICCLEFIRLTSSVWSSSAGLVKSVVLIGISIIIDPIKLSAVHLTGMVMVFGAFVIFGRLTMKRRNQGVPENPQAVTERSSLVKDSDRNKNMAVAPPVYASEPAGCHKAQLYGPSRGVEIVNPSNINGSRV